VSDSALMTKTVLFMDLDGVAHPADAASAMPNRTVYGEDLFRWLEPLMQLLAEFPKVEVVLHSSWRHVYRDEASLRADLPRALEARVVGVTPVEIGDRQTSIEEYCRREGVTRFVAIDDTAQQFDEGLPWLVLCGPDGLSNAQTVQALREALQRA
jgi:hypothetical protein